MYKLILLVKRKPGLTHEEFRAHYEANHAPLARRSLPHLHRYVRNFLAAFPGQPEPEFDCITEFWFETRDAMETSMTWARSEEGQVLARDEELFMDRPAIRVYKAEEIES